MEIPNEELAFGERVGTGITAEVFKGTWKGNVVAIKQIVRGKKAAGRSELLQQVAFTREVSVMSKVKHEHLVQFFGVCFADGQLRLISEFCGGGDLFELLHNQEDLDLVWSQQVKMATDVADAMEYLHNFTPQIIHRDLKSLNLLLMKAIKSERDVPNVKVSDLGLARMREMDDEWTNMTKAAGTCQWMAPEVHSGSYDEKADVFSYAMVLFEIIAREIPFEDEDSIQVVEIIAKGGRPDLEAVPPDRPQAFQDIMEQCWNQGPSSRPPFAEIAMRLRAIKT